MSKIKNAQPKNLIGKILDDSIGYTGDGKWGRAIQKEYDKAGIKTNYGPGPDLPQFNNKEIKSKDEKSNSSVTVGTAKISTIIETNGEVFMEKLQNWDLHLLDNGIVLKTEKLDFAKMQNYIKDELVKITDQLKCSIPLTGWTVAETDMFILERVKENDNRYGKLRVKGHKFNRFKRLTKSTFFDLFEEA